MVCLPDAYRCWRRLKSYLKIKTMVEAVHQMQVFQIFQRKHPLAQIQAQIVIHDVLETKYVPEYLKVTRSSTPSNSLIPVSTQRHERVTENFRSLFSPYGPSARSSWLRPPPGKNPQERPIPSQRNVDTRILLSS